MNNSSNSSIPYIKNNFVYIPENYQDKQIAPPRNLSESNITSGTTYSLRYQQKIDYYS